MNNDKKWILYEIRNNKLTANKIKAIFDCWHFNDDELLEVTDAVLVAKNPYTLYKLASFGHNSKEKEIINELIKSKCGEALLLAEVIPGFDKERLISLYIAKSKNIISIIYIASHVSNAPINELTKVILKEGKTNEIKDFIWKTAIANLNRIDTEYVTNYVISHEMPSEILFFLARMNKNVPTCKINKYLLKDGNMDVLTKYAIYIDGAPIDEIIQMAINKNAFTSLYELAKNLDSSYTDKITTAMEKCDDVELIKNYCRNIPNIKPAKLFDRIQELPQEDQNLFDDDERFEKAITYEYSEEKTFAFTSILNKCGKVGLINAYHEVDNIITKQQLYYLLCSDLETFGDILDFYSPFFHKILSKEQENELDNKFIRHINNNGDNLSK